MYINEILNQIFLIYKKKGLIQSIFANNNDNNDPNELLLIDTMDLLEKYSQNENHFKMAIGLNATITDEGNYNFTAKMYIGKGINEDDFITRFSKNERTNLVNYYKVDSNDFLNKYVNISEINENEIEILKRKLMLLSLRFHITSIYPTLPVPLESIGKTFGFQKMLSNLIKYKPGYKLTGMNTISIDDLINTMEDFFRRNVKFFRVNKENILFYKSKIIQQKCGLDYYIFKQTIQPISNLNELTITHRSKILSIQQTGFVDGKDMTDISNFLNNETETGIVILPYFRTESPLNVKKYLVIVRFCTKVTSLTKEEEKILRDIFIRKGIEGLSEINETANKLSWKYKYIIDYIKLPDLEGFLNTFENGVPTELYWNDTATNLNKFLLALSLNNEDEIFMCPMIGTADKITGSDIKIISSALKQKGNKKITIIDKHNN